MLAVMGVTAVVLAVILIPLSGYLAQTEHDRITTALERDAFVIAGRSEESLETPGAQGGSAITDLARQYRASSAGARIVVTDADGIAIVTSDDDTTAVGSSYASRPEIATALTGRIANGTRYSQTLSEQLLYVAVPVLSGGRVLLEAVPSTGGFGEHFGTVGGLVSGLADNRGQALLDGGARRMRALTGYDRVTVVCGDQRAESCRGSFAGPADMGLSLPAIIADTDAESIALFPRDEDESSADAALLRAPGQAVLDALSRTGVRATLVVPFDCDGLDGEFRCESRGPCEPSFELHAAAELFAQLFAMRLRIDGLRNS